MTFDFDAYVTAALFSASGCAFALGDGTVRFETGETIEAHGVTIMGPLNLPSTMAAHASAMLGRNVLTLLQHLAGTDGTLHLDVNDEITGAMAVTHDGQARI